jgi:hypothetical protein
MRSSGLVRRLGVKRYTKINLVRNMKIMGSNTKISNDSENYGGGSLSVVKPFSLRDTYSVASLSHINMYR